MARATASLARNRTRDRGPVPRTRAFPRLRGALACALVAALSEGAAAAPPDATVVPTLEALMAGMAGTPGVSARFVERKEIALLSEPIESRGALVFVPPDHLRRTTSTPSHTELVIAGERFSFRDAAGGDLVDLSASPLAREFVESFIVLFNGDLAKLRERYEPEFAATGSAWSLALRPRRRPLSDLIERITLSGSGPRLERMEMFERDGDRTTTQFSDVEIDRRFTPAEREQLFAPPAPGDDGP